MVNEIVRTLVLVAGFAATGITAQDAVGAVGAANAPSLLARVVTIGASVSEGAGNGLPLARVLDHAIRIPHRRVQQRTTVFWSFDLEGHAEHVLDDALSMKPTLVVGVDVLFWFAYGRAPKNEDEAAWRIRRVEVGLKQLDRIRCPLVLGDIPDMSGANKAILWPTLIPSRTARRAVNRRIDAWIAKRPHVIKAPVATWVERLRAGRWVIPASPDGIYPNTVLGVDRAMSGDGLHPSQVGQVALADALIKLMRTRLGARVDGLRFEPWRDAHALGVLPKLRRRRV